jgi:phage tail sheath protein FI
MTVTYTLGVNVVETDGRATPGVVPSDTSVTGFVVRSQRGPLDGRVVRVTNWSQFLDQFGGFVATGGDPPPAAGAYAVKGFFDNGGSVAWVTRVANQRQGATPATLTTSPGARRLAAPGRLYVSIDGGAPVAVAFTGTPATLTGAAPPPSGSFDLLGGGTEAKITLVVDGVRQEHVLTPADVGGSLTTASADGLADVLNRELTGVQVYVEEGKLTMRTDTRGRSASVRGLVDDDTDKTRGKVAGILGLADQATGDGTVNDLDAVTPEEAAAILRGALAAAGPVAVAVDHDRVLVAHTEAGPGHSLRAVVPSGATDSVHAVFGLDTDLHTGAQNEGDVRAATPARFVLRSLGSEALSLTAAYRGSVDAGEWANELRISVAANRKAALFDLVVARQAPGQAEPAVVETVAGLPRAAGDAALPATLNDPETGSRYVRLDAPAPVEIPVPGPGEEPLPLEVAAPGVDDGYPGDVREDELAAADLVAGIDRFDRVAVQLLCCPESDLATVTAAGIAACARHGDRMFVGHLADGIGVETAIGDGEKLQQEKAYGAVYFPWIVVTNPADGKPVAVPPDGHVLGVYARTATERGVWKAPAGSAARITGALDVRTPLTDVELTLLAREAGVNGVRYQPGQGIVVASSRTLSVNPLWWYVNVRLLFNFVKASLRDSLRWTVQEPNTPELRAKVVYGSVLPFLRGLALAGAFGSVIDSYTVKCDDENNPPATVTQGLLIIEVYFYPSRPAETIVITIGQQDGAATASES